MKLATISLIAPAYLTNGVYSNNIDTGNTKWNGAELTLEKNSHVKLRWKGKEIYFPMSAVLSYSPAKEG